MLKLISTIIIDHKNSAKHIVITISPTPLGLVFLSFLIFLPSWFLIDVLIDGPLHGPAILSVIVLLSAVGAVRFVKTRRFLKNRTINLRKIASLPDINAVFAGPGEGPGLSPNLYNIAKRDRKYENILKADDWTYADFSYAVYRKTKHDEFKTAVIHYSLLEVDYLERFLIFFLIPTKHTANSFA